MPRTTIRTSLILIFILNAFVSEAIAVTTIGKYDCGQWFTSSTAKNWLAGYISGLNTSGIYPKKDPLLKLNSSAQLNLWMDNYCNANPLDTVADGANALFRELADKSKP